MPIAGLRRRHDSVLRGGDEHGGWWHGVHDAGEDGVYGGECDQSV